MYNHPIIREQQSWACGLPDREGYSGIVTVDEELGNDILFIRGL